MFIRTFLVLLTLAAFTMRTNAAESTNRLLFPVTGFSIIPLETTVGKAPQRALFMALPGFGEIFRGRILRCELKPFAFKPVKGL